MKNKSKRKIDFTKIYSFFRKLIKLSFTSKKGIVLLIFCFFNLLVLLSYPYFISLPLKKGKIAPKTILSPRTIEYIDTEQTNKIKERIRQKAGIVYVISPEIVEKSLMMIDKIFLPFFQSKGKSEIQSHLAYLEKLKLSSRTIKRLKEADNKELTNLRLQLYKLIREVMKKGIRESDMNRLDEIISPFVEEVTQDQSLKKFFMEVSKFCIFPNLVYDHEGTEHSRKIAESQIQPVKGKILAGSVIVKEGEIINQKHVDILKELGMFKSKVIWLKLIGFALLFISILILQAYVLKIYFSRIFNDDRLTFVILLIITFTFLLARGVVYLPLSGYILTLPISVCAFLLIYLVDPFLSILLSISSAIVLTPILHLQLEHLITASISAVVVFLIVKSSRKVNAISAMFYLMSANFLLIFVFNLINPGGTTYINVLKDLILNSFVNGFLAIVIGIGVLPYFEGIFKITTSHQLLELTNLEQPLLRRLSQELPDVYQHSIMVANIAEVVAEELSINSLLAKVAGLYHDIGKLKRTSLYQTQSSFENFSPTLSALVIASHVKEAMDIASEYKLPKEITDIIMQHHGTFYVSYFYELAKLQAKNGEEIPVDRFRYPGPKPQTIEAAVIMIADACEASVRALKKINFKQIEHQIDVIIEERLSDRQFDECNLTLKQIEIIKSVITKQLLSIYHERIMYPSQKANLEEEE